MTTTILPFNRFYGLILEKKEQTVVFVPGSFKPPHRGHWEMVKHYSKIAGPNGKVIVVIGAPTKKEYERSTITGGVIAPEISKRIFEIFEDATDLGNVEFVIPDIPSPVTWSTEKAKKEYNNPSYSVLFGRSSKEDDISKFSFLKDWHKKENLKFKLLDATENAAPSYMDLSASELRDRIIDEKFIKASMPRELDEGSLNRIVHLLQ